MLKLITFAGTGPYSAVTYRWRHHTHTGSFFCEALQHWLSPEETLIVLTPDAERHPNWETLQRLRGAAPLRIPEVKSESDLWEIFRRISESVRPEDAVVLDITHGFRSLPVIALVSAFYLQTLMGASITHILYAAFEARDAAGVCPVFDLNLFLRLQRWTFAAAALQTSGDARLFAALLTETQQELRSSPSAAGDPPEALPTRLKTAGAALEQVSRALSLTRPDEVAALLPDLFRKLDQARTQFDRWALPFSRAIGLVEDAWRPLAGGGLEGERALAVWYFRHGHLLQAVTLGREWLVSCTAAMLGRGNLRKRLSREPVEQALNHAVIRRRELLQGPGAELLPAFDGLLQAPLLEALWARGRDLRNDLAHCGMNENRVSASSLEQNAQRFIAGLEEITLPGSG